MQAGVILFVDRYDACVAFYRDVIGLPVVLVLETLTIFAFGDSYLEIERGGPPAGDKGKGRDRNPVVLRFDVADIASTLAVLRTHDVAVVHRRFDWGEVGMFVDPDGNRCEIKAHDPAQTVAQDRHRA